MKKFFKNKNKEPVCEQPPTLGSFPDFTKKEIFTQGALLDSFMNRYIRADKLNFDYLKIKIDKIKRIYIIGSNTDYACALYGAYNFEVLLDVVTVAICNGEFLCSNPVLDKHTLAVILGDDENVKKRCRESRAVTVCISDYGEGKGVISLDCKTLGDFASASHSLKMLALAMLALYLGEKNQIITRLYVKIATQMMKGLPDKIKNVLSKEFIINEFAESINFEKLFITGINVDFACAVYAAAVFSQLTDICAVPVPYSQLYGNIGINCGVLGLASNIDFCTTLNADSHMFKIMACAGVELIDDKTVIYDESIPLLNPILSGVIIQLIAYHKYLSNSE